MAFGIGFLGKIFGSEKALDNAVGAVARGLDSLIYTDEEKSDDAREERKQARAMVVDWMDKTKGQNLARRFLAFIIAGTWLAQYWFIMTMSVGAIWVDAEDTQNKITASVEVIGAAVDGMTGAMMLILGFYFAAPHIGNIIGPAMARFGKQSGDGK